MQVTGRGKRRESGTGTRWYEKGLRFSCQECRSCCGGAPGYVWVTREEMDLLAAFLGKTTKGFREESVRRVDRRWSLKERANGDCVLVGEQGCRAYEARPVQCRTWPFWPENVRSEQRWVTLAEECEGMGKGRQYSAQEVEQLMGLSGPGRKWLKGFAELLRVYREADAWAAEREASCDACGECCDFEGQGHRLYASLVEAGWMLYCQRPGKAIEENRCPYHVEGRCANRAGRTLGCRTYFCRGVNVPEAFAYHEELLARLKKTTLQLGLPWRYDRIDRILRGAEDQFRGRLFCTFSP